MRERPRTTLVLLVCAAMLAIVVAGSWLFRRSTREKHAEADGQQAAWQAHNAAVLMALSVARGPSAAEQARLTRAGNDPEQLRQALIEIHELRRAYAQRDLADAQQRRGAPRERGASSDESAQETGSAALVQQDANSAQAQIASYSEALAAIRAWQPVSYPDFLAQRSAAPSPVLAADEPGPSSPLQKVDPRVPMASGGPSRRPTTTLLPRPQAGVKRPATASDEIASQDLPPPVLAETDVADQPHRNQADVAAREQNEAAIRITLQRWAQAMLQNDPKAESPEYAAHMDRYFLRTDVDRAFVEADKNEYLRRGNLTASFAVKDVRFENETADAADVRLVKEVTWQRSANGITQKAIRSRLHLIRTEAGWKIAGEQDFR